MGGGGGGVRKCQSSCYLGEGPILLVSEGGAEGPILLVSEGGANPPAIWGRGQSCCYLGEA